VVLEVLPRAMAENPERLERFRREVKARAARALLSFRETLTR
jgi:hypothetical protein